MEPDEAKVRVEANLNRISQYVDQLEAHMDSDGKIGLNNVRDLIQMIHELVGYIEGRIEVHGS